MTQVFLTVKKTCVILYKHNLIYTNFNIEVNMVKRLMLFLYFAVFPIFK